MFKYETHVHSKEGSACSCSSAGELVKAYYDAGYAGFVLTDHFIHGNTSVPHDLPWEERMQLYYDAYLEAKEEGKKYDFDVLFGIEHAYGYGKEVLIYGIDLEFLQKHPELEYADLETYAHMVHEVGGILVHAHPHRVREYITPNVKPRYDVCDGIEVYNACDELEINELAMQDAVRLHKIMTSGGDVHKTTAKNLGQAGMFFKRRMKTNKELVTALKDNVGKLLINGECVNENHSDYCRKD